jgi:hypothetical protein
LGLFEIGYFQHLVNQDVLFGWGSSPLGAQVSPPMSNVSAFLPISLPTWLDYGLDQFLAPKNFHKILPRRFLLAKPADIEKTEYHELR